MHQGRRRERRPAAALLDEEGLAENTIVVYASDQGFYLGEHGWFDKRWIFEESLRTPLLVRWPGVVKPGSHDREIVSNLDFAETFLDAAGLPIPAEMQGRSLVPLLKGQDPADWRTSFYYHYYEYPRPHNVRRHYGVVTDRYKLVHFYEPEVNEWELFDLKTDPLELKSVYGQPDLAAVQQELGGELERLRRELQVPVRLTRKRPRSSRENTRTTMRKIPAACLSDPWPGNSRVRTNRSGTASSGSSAGTWKNRPTSTRFPGARPRPAPRPQRSGGLVRAGYPLQEVARSSSIASSR